MMLGKFKKFYFKIKFKIFTLFARHNSLNYINGNEILPPPLTEAEEDEAIERIESEEAKCLLIERNLRLVVYIAKRFENTGVGIEELISIGTVGLMKAVSTFNVEKSIKLATYASRCIENEILMFIRKNATKKREISFDEPLSVDYDGNELLLSDILGGESDTVTRHMEEEEERRILCAAVEELTPRERVIIEMRYGLGGREELTQKEVADALGISQSYISRLEKKIMARLRKKIEEKI